MPPSTQKVVPPKSRRTPWLIIGCGYAGRHLAWRLIEGGAKVIITRRGEHPPRELEPVIEAGAEYRSFDLDDEPIDLSWLHQDTRLVACAPPVREVEAAGEREKTLVAALKPGAVRRVVYLSSTGVYPRGTGQPTGEHTAVGPVAAHGVARLAAETAMLAARVPVVALRIAGIYGPGRGVVERMRTGLYRVIGDGTGYVSRIHVHDLVSAIIAAATVEPLPHTIVNVADDDPSPSLEIALEIARRTSVPAPPIIPVDQVDARVAALVGSNRRVTNERLKRDFGVTLRYPSWRDSIDELIDHC